jgi:hypothetical protein
VLLEEEVDHGLVGPDLVVASKRHELHVLREAKKLRRELIFATEEGAPELVVGLLFLALE